LDFEGRFMAFKIAKVADSAPGHQFFDGETRGLRRAFPIGIEIARPSCLVGVSPTFPLDCACR
jgi:hypothetical protein